MTFSQNVTFSEKGGQIDISVRLSTAFIARIEPIFLHTRQDELAKNLQFNC